jgi:DNA-binding response OmpR family regulator
MLVSGQRFRALTVGGPVTNPWIHFIPGSILGGGSLPQADVPATTSSITLYETIILAQDPAFYRGCVIRLLLIEDDLCLAKTLTRALDRERYRVEMQREGRAGLRELLSGQYSVCILDLLLPGCDGFHILKQVRQRGIGTPILIVSGRSAVSDRVQGLKLGADDFLVKPFAFPELLARLDAILRRGQTPTGILRAGALILNPSVRRATRAGADLSLSLRQFALLELLMRHSESVVPRATILRELWGQDFDPASNLVDVHVAHLRKKIDTPGNPSLIQSIRGVGYKIQLAPCSQMSVRPEPDV